MSKSVTQVPFSDHQEILNCANINDFRRYIPPFHKIHFNIVHINIRSLVRNFSYVTQLISSSKLIIDVLILTEVNINDNIVSMFNISGYKTHSKLRKNRKGGGIMLYVRDIHVFSLVSHSLLHCESIIGKITTPFKYTANICAIYRPPSESKHLFIQELKSFLSRSTFQLCDTYMLGDVNINLKTYDNIRDYYISSMSECGLTSAISDFTRIEIRGNNTTRSCIDHIFARTRSLDLYSAALGTVMADHRLIILSCVGFETTQIQGDTSMIKLIDNNKVKSLLNKVDWSEI